MSSQQPGSLITPRPARPKPRTRLSRKDGMALVKAWENSELTEPDFCKQRGVKVDRLRYWLRRRDGEALRTDTPSQNVVVVPFSVPDGQVVDCSPEAVTEITGPGGLSVRVPVSASRTQLIEILSALRAVQEVVK